MPLIPYEYVGPTAAARFFGSIFAAGRRFSLVPTRANGQPAVGAYVLASDGVQHAAGLFVLQLAGDRICAMTRFENTVLPGSACHDRSPTSAEQHVSIQANLSIATMDFSNRRQRRPASSRVRVIRTHGNRRSGATLEHPTLIAHISRSVAMGQVSERHVPNRRSGTG